MVGLREDTVGLHKVGKCKPHHQHSTTSSVLQMYHFAITKSRDPFFCAYVTGCPPLEGMSLSGIEPLSWDPLPVRHTGRRGGGLLRMEPMPHRPRLPGNPCNRPSVKLIEIAGGGKYGAVPIPSGHPHTAEVVEVCELLPPVLAGEGLDKTTCFRGGAIFLVGHQCNKHFFEGRGGLGYPFHELLRA